MGKMKYLLYYPDYFSISNFFCPQREGKGGGEIRISDIRLIRRGL